MLYTNIKSEIIQCKSCPLYADLDYGCLPQWGMGSKVATTLILNLRASQESHLVEKPIEPKYSLLLRKILEQANINESEVFVTNLLKCKCSLTPKKSFKEYINICKNQWLNKEIQAIPTLKSLVCFGGTTSQFLWQDIKQIDSSEIIMYNNLLVFQTHSFEEIFRKGQSYMDHAITTLKLVKEYNAKISTTR